MPKIQFAHSTAFGTYYVECEVIERKEDEYKIRFFDDIAGEPDERWVERHSLQFPKFSEYGAI